MKVKILITGSSGFVGKNVLQYFEKDAYLFDCINLRNNNLDKKFVDYDAYLHLAGKAHDLKNIADPDEYYQINTELTKKIFDDFLQSNATVFIFISSVKAAADKVDGVLTESSITNPQTHYGKSKLLAEQYISSKNVPSNKRVFILRPCMIHGPGNKGNMNVLFNFIKKKIPWPLGKFKNKRSFLSIENLCFVIKNFIERENIISGVYNVSDDSSISTNELISIISSVIGTQPKIWYIPKKIIVILAKIGSWFKLPFNTESLQKLTEDYVVSNRKLISALNAQLPVETKEGLIKTIRSFVYVN